MVECNTVLLPSYGNWTGGIAEVGPRWRRTIQQREDSATWMATTSPWTKGMMVRRNPQTFRSLLTIKVLTISNREKVSCNTGKGNRLYRITNKDFCLDKALWDFWTWPSCDIHCGTTALALQTSIVQQCYLVIIPSSQQHAVFSEQPDCICKINITWAIHSLLLTTINSLKIKSSFSKCSCYLGESFSSLLRLIKYLNSVQEPPYLFLRPFQASDAAPAMPKSLQY